MTEEAENTKETVEKKTKWYFSKSSLVVSFIVAGPFMLPLVWFNPKYSLVKKTVITAIILGITFLLMLWMKNSLQNLWDVYEQLKSEM